MSHTSQMEVTPESTIQVVQPQSELLPAASAQVYSNQLENQENIPPLENVSTDMSLSKSRPEKQGISSVVDRNELRLDLSYIDSASSSDQGDVSPQTWHKNPLLVKRTKKRKDRPLSAEIHYTPPADNSPSASPRTHQSPRIYMGSPMLKRKQEVAKKNRRSPRRLSAPNSLGERTYSPRKPGSAGSTPRRNSDLIQEKLDKFAALQKKRHALDSTSDESIDSPKRVEMQEIGSKEQSHKHRRGRTSGEISPFTRLSSPYERKAIMHDNQQEYEQSGRKISRSQEDIRQYEKRESTSTSRQVDVHHMHQPHPRIHHGHSISDTPDIQRHLKSQMDFRKVQEGQQHSIPDGKFYVPEQNKQKPFEGYLNVSSSFENIYDGIDLSMHLSVMDRIDPSEFRRICENDPKIAEQVRNMQEEMQRNGYEPLPKVSNPKGNVETNAAFKEKWSKQVEIKSHQPNGHVTQNQGKIYPHDKPLSRPAHPGKLLIPQQVSCHTHQQRSMLQSQSSTSPPSSLSQQSGSWYVPRSDQEQEPQSPTKKMDAKMLIEEEQRKFADYKAEYKRRLSEKESTSGTSGDEKKESGDESHSGKVIPPDDYEYILRKVHHQRQNAIYEAGPPIDHSRSVSMASTASRISSHDASQDQYLHEMKQRKNIQQHSKGKQTYLTDDILPPVPDEKKEVQGETKSFGSPVMKNQYYTPGFTGNEHSTYEASQPRNRYFPSPLADISSEDMQNNEQTLTFQQPKLCDMPKKKYFPSPLSDHQETVKKDVEERDVKVPHNRYHTTPLSDPLVMQAQSMPSLFSSTEKKSGPTAGKYFPSPLTSNQASSQSSKTRPTPQNKQNVSMSQHPVHVQMRHFSPPLSPEYNSDSNTQSVQRRQTDHKTNIQHRRSWDPDSFQSSHHQFVDRTPPQSRRVKSLHPQHVAQLSSTEQWDSVTEVTQQNQRDNMPPKHQPQYTGVQPSQKIHRSHEIHSNGYINLTQQREPQQQWDSVSEIEKHPGMEKIVDKKEFSKVMPDHELKQLSRSPVQKMQQSQIPAHWESMDKASPRQHKEPMLNKHYYKAMKDVARPQDLQSRDRRPIYEQSPGSLEENGYFRPIATYPPSPRSSRHIVDPHQKDQDGKSKDEEYSYHKAPQSLVKQYSYGTRDEDSMSPSRYENSQSFKPYRLQHKGDSKDEPQNYHRHIPSQQGQMDQPRQYGSPRQTSPYSPHVSSPLSAESRIDEAGMQQRQVMIQPQYQNLQQLPQLPHRRSPACTSQSTSNYSSAVSPKQYGSYEQISSSQTDWAPLSSPRPGYASPGRDQLKYDRTVQTNVPLGNQRYAHDQTQQTGTSFEQNQQHPHQFPWQYEGPTDRVYMTHSGVLYGDAHAEPELQKSPASRPGRQGHFHLTSQLTGHLRRAGGDKDHVYGPGEAIKDRNRMKADSDQYNVLPETTAKGHIGKVTSSSVKNLNDHNMQFVHKKPPTPKRENLPTEPKEWQYSTAYVGTPPPQEMERFLYDENRDIVGYGKRHEKKHISDEDSSAQKKIQEEMSYSGAPYPTYEDKVQSYCHNHKQSRATAQYERHVQKSQEKYRAMKKNTDEEDHEKWKVPLRRAKSLPRESGDKPKAVAATQPSFDIQVKLKRSATQPASDRPSGFSIRMSRSEEDLRRHVTESDNTPHISVKSIKDRLFGVNGEPVYNPVNQNELGNVWDRRERKVSEIAGGVFNREDESLPEYDKPVPPSSQQFGEEQDVRLSDYISYKDGQKRKTTTVDDVLTDLELTYENLKLESEEWANHMNRVDLGMRHNDLYEGTSTRAGDDEVNVKRLSITNLKKLEEIQQAVDNPSLEYAKQWINIDNTRKVPDPEQSPVHREKQGTESVEIPQHSQASYHSESQSMTSEQRSHDYKYILPRKIADDMAVRKHHQVTASISSSHGVTSHVGSYLARSPVETPSPSVESLTRRSVSTSITQPVADPVYDDMQYRNIQRAKSPGACEIDRDLLATPSPTTTDYLNSRTTEPERGRMRIRPAYKADKYHDDMAYRKLRKDIEPIKASLPDAYYTMLHGCERPQRRSLSLDRLPQEKPTQPTLQRSHSVGPGERRHSLEKGVAQILRVFNDSLENTQSAPDLSAKSVFASKYNSEGDLISDDPKYSKVASKVKKQQTPRTVKQRHELKSKIKLMKTSADSGYLESESDSHSSSGPENRYSRSPPDGGFDSDELDQSKSSDSTMECSPSEGQSRMNESSNITSDVLHHRPKDGFHKQPSSLEQKSKGSDFDQQKQQTSRGYSEHAVTTETKPVLTTRVIMPPFAQSKIKEQTSFVQHKPTRHISDTPTTRVIMPPFAQSRIKEQTSFVQHKPTRLISDTPILSTKKSDERSVEFAEVRNQQPLLEMAKNGIKQEEAYSAPEIMSSTVSTPQGLSEFPNAELEKVQPRQPVFKVPERLRQAMASTSPIPSAPVVARDSEVIKIAQPGSVKVVKMDKNSTEEPGKWKTEVHRETLVQEPNLHSLRQDSEKSSKELKTFKDDNRKVTIVRERTEVRHAGKTQMTVVEHKCEPQQMMPFADAGPPDQLKPPYLAQRVLSPRSAALLAQSKNSSHLVRRSPFSPTDFSDGEMTDATDITLDNLVRTNLARPSSPETLDMSSDWDKASDKGSSDGSQRGTTRRQHIETSSTRKVTLSDSRTCTVESSGPNGAKVERTPSFKELLRSFEDKTSLGMKVSLFKQPSTEDVRSDGSAEARPPRPTSRRHVREVWGSDPNLAAATQGSVSSSDSKHGGEGSPRWRRY